MSDGKKDEARDTGQGIGAGVGSRARIWLLVGALFAFTIGGAEAARQSGWPAGTPGRVDPLDPAGLSQTVSSEALRLSARLDRSAVHVGSNGELHLELTATGTESKGPREARRPTDVVVVLDRSGSMGGEPLAKALAAVRELISRLSAGDRLALVTYANASELVIPLSDATPQARERWLAQIASITAGGGTNMSAGLDRADALVSSTREVGRMARVLLLSDGHANQGDATPAGLSRRAARALRGEYVLSSVGVGDGFDERLMARLADAGTGNFYYVPHVEVLGGIFEDEFESARETVASALEIRIDTPPGVVVVDAAGYPIERHAGHAILRPGALFAGQSRSLWITLRVPADRAGTTRLGDVHLRYSPSQGGERQSVVLADLPQIAAVVDESRFVASLDGDAVARHHADDVVNRVRQSVSELVSRGQYGAAQQALDSVDYGELEALGYMREETGSFRDLEALKDEIEAAAAAPPAEQSTIQNELGKRLLEAGTDGRRKGAKR